MNVKEALDKTPVATLMAVPLVITGCVIAIVNPDALSFSELCKDVGISSGGIGLLGLARSAMGKG